MGDMTDDKKWSGWEFKAGSGNLSIAFGDPLPRSTATIGHDIATGSVFAVGASDDIVFAGIVEVKQWPCPECQQIVGPGQIWCVLNRDVEPRVLFVWHADCHHKRFELGHDADCRRDECTCLMRFI